MPRSAVEMQDRRTRRHRRLRRGRTRRGSWPPFERHSASVLLAPRADRWAAGGRGAGRTWRGAACTWCDPPQPTSTTAHTAPKPKARVRDISPVIRRGAACCDPRSPPCSGHGCGSAGPCSGMTPDAGGLVGCRVRSAAMPRTGRVSLGLLGLGWAAIAVASVGIAATPATWCSEISQPAGQQLLHVGSLVAGLAIALSFVPALVVPAYAGERLRDWPTPRLTIAWLGTASALISLVVLAPHFASLGGACG